jgi:hypothetical protein
VTEREAKRLACFWVREMLCSDQPTHFIYGDGESGLTRHHDDIKRLENAFGELELEMARRSGER